VGKSSRNYLQVFHYVKGKSVGVARTGMQKALPNGVPIWILSEPQETKKKKANC